MNTTTYYLFGQCATDHYFDNEGMSADELAKAIIEMDYSVALFDMYSHPSELLVEFMGWDGFSEINEDLYTLLLNNLKE
jgi:hypothetical protein